MNAEAKNVSINIASYYVDVNNEAIEFFRYNYEMINGLLPKDIDSISTSNDSAKPNTLIVVSHTKTLSEIEIKNLVNSLFENLSMVN